MQLPPAEAAHLEPRQLQHRRPLHLSEGQHAASQARQSDRDHAPERQGDQRGTQRDEADYRSQCGSHGGGGGGHRLGGLVFGPPRRGRQTGCRACAVPRAVLARTQEELFRELHKFEPVGGDLLLRGQCGRRPAEQADDRVLFEEEPPGWQFNWFFDRLNHGLNHLGAYLGAYLGAFPV